MAGVFIRERKGNLDTETRGRPCGNGDRDGSEATMGHKARAAAGNQEAAWEGLSPSLRSKDADSRCLAAGTVRE